jgi:hypothetical protein
MEPGREHAAIRRATPTRKLDAFDIAGRTENADLTGAKARAVLRIIDCLIFLQKDGSTPGASKTFQPHRCGLISRTVGSLPTKKD